MRGLAIAILYRIKTRLEIEKKLGSIVKLMSWEMWAIEFECKLFDLCMLIDFFERLDLRYKLCYGWLQINPV